LTVVFLVLRTSLSPLRPYLNHSCLCPFCESNDVFLHYLVGIANLDINTPGNTDTSINPSLKSKLSASPLAFALHSSAMCVRTKTSYGCGHEFKTTKDCRSSHCPGLERYLYQRNGDCRACKEGGDAVTRGREGKGRYAQEINRRTPHVEASSHERPARDSSSLTLDVGAGISPWGPPLKREKEWQSPSRRKADDAWLQEHVERNVELQTIRESISSASSSSSDRASTAIYSPPHRDGRGYEYDHEYHHDREDVYSHPQRREVAPRSLQTDGRSTHNDHERGSTRPVYRRQRHDSQESFQSLHSTRSSTRKYKPAPTSYTTYDPYEAYDSGYGSYGSRASNGYETAKTEPYSHSPLPRTVSVKPPSATSYGVYQTGFGVGGVDIVTRTPMYAYPTRRY